MKRIRLLLTLLIVLAFGSLTSLAANNDAAYPEIGRANWGEVGSFTNVKKDMDNTYYIETKDRVKDSDDAYGTTDSSKYNWRKITNKNNENITINIIVNSEDPVNILIYDIDTKDSNKTKGAPLIKYFNEAAGVHTYSYNFPAKSERYIAICNAYDDRPQSVSFHIIGSDKFNRDYKSKYTPKNVNVSYIMTSIDGNFFYESTVRYDDYTDTSYHIAEFSKEKYTENRIYQDYIKTDEKGGVQSLYNSNKNLFADGKSKNISFIPRVTVGGIDVKFPQKKVNVEYKTPDEFFANAKYIDYGDTIQGGASGAAYRVNLPNIDMVRFLPIENTDDNLTYISVWKKEGNQYIKLCDRMMTKFEYRFIAFDKGEYYIFIAGLKKTSKLKFGNESEAIKVTQINMQSSSKLNVGNTLDLSKGVTLSPKEATCKYITWKSSKPKVAKVSKDGVVTARNAGTAVITATSGNASATCIIKVVKKKPTLKIGVEKKVIKYSVLSKRNVTFDLKIKSQSKKKQVFKNAGLIYIKVSKRGKITMPQGLAKGKYKVKVAVVSPETKKYKKREISKYITIVVK